MAETIKIKVSIQTNKVGSKCTDIAEFDRAEWEAMTPAEQEENCRQIAFNMGDWGWEVVE